MKQSGVIYQYVDKPAPADQIVIDAVSGSIPAEIDHSFADTRSAIISRSIAIPANEPVRIIAGKPEVSLSLKTKLSYTFHAMIGGGVIGLIILLSPFMITEARLRLNPPVPQEEIQFPDIEIVDQVVDTPTFSKLINDKYVKKLNPVNTDYSLIIPKIGINSPVIANVDPGNKSEYNKALKEGAAQAKGTALPDEAGTQYIFAHSTDYIWNISQFNAIFYLLKDLEPEDQVHIVYHGKLYPYKVTGKKIVNADDTYYLKRNMNDDHLILQTCYPPGTTWKRMLVFAEPIDNVLGSGDNISYNVDNPDID